MKTLPRLGLFAPLGIFLLILLIGYYGFQLEDPHRLPSALLGQPFPEFRAPLLEPSRPFKPPGEGASAVAGAGGAPAAARQASYVSRDDLLGDALLVNVWATWCPTCKAEHDELARIRLEEQVRIVGINYKDDPAAARRWLREFGNPYDFNIVDLNGALGVELGVYGAPETFLLDAEGIIVYKRIGEITRQIWLDELAPRIARLRANGAGTG